MCTLLVTLEPTHGVMGQNTAAPPRAANGEENAAHATPRGNSAPASRGIAVLPNTVHDFPKQDPAGAFPDLKIYDAAGRPWRAATEDWEGARRRVQDDPAWGEWLGRQREGVDQWRKHFPQDRIEWTCGWWHDFVSPQNGSYLTWTPEIPHEEVAFLHGPSDQRVGITPKIFGGWVFGFRGRHAEKIREAAALYRLTGERIYAQWAAGQLDFYAAHLADWPPSERTFDGGRSKLYWQTLDEAVNLVLYTEGVRLLGDYVSPERRLRWKEKFFDPEAALLDATRLEIHNIALWHRCASAGVALCFGDAARWQQALDGEWGLRRQLAAGVTSDYVWYEQSFGYNAYALMAMLNLFKSAGLAGRADELAQEMATAENLSLSLISLRFPDGKLPNPADAGGRRGAPDPELLTAVYRVFPTTLGLAGVAGQRNWDTLVDPPPLPPRPPTVPPARSGSLASTRLAVLKSGRWQVFVHYGQLTASHAQAELPNFEASFGDTDITHDPGTVGYGSPLHHEYYRCGLNHNVPLFDGEGQDTVPQAGVLDSFAESPAQVSISLPAYRRNAAVSRNLRIEGDKLMDVVAIRSTEGTAPHRLGLSLHVQGQVTLPEAFESDPAFGSGRPDAFKHWTGVTKAAYKDEAVFDVLCGAQRMRVAISAPGAFTVWHGSTPDSPPARREGFYVEAFAPAATFTTVLSPAE